MAEQEVSKDEQVGFHKGSLSTLAKERQELLKMVNIVEQLMQMHVKALQELGVDLQKMAEEAEKQQGEKKPIEDIIKKEKKKE
ncbi:hypothetical protein JW930_03470 [Candidatus Woesearchaeota archaeon]|nr:hypothetical protein [Candidatus Woesearchaeota archaeon]